MGRLQMSSKIQILTLSLQMVHVLAVDVSFGVPKWQKISFELRPAFTLSLRERDAAPRSASPTGRASKKGAAG